MKKSTLFIIAAIIVVAAIAPVSLYGNGLQTPPGDTATIKIYPNPVVNKMEIRSNVDLSNATIKVYDDKGEQIMERKFADGIIYLNENRRPLRQAMYLLQVTDQNGMSYAAVKFIRFKE